MLGLIGYLQTGHETVASAVYNTFGLFTRSFTVPPQTSPSSLPVALEVARFLAPILTLAAAAGVAIQLSRDTFDRATARRRRRDHVVVCGLGRVGTTCAQRLHDNGMPIVAVERSRTVPSVATMRRAGIPVVAGDATDTEVLTRRGSSTEPLGVGRGRLDRWTGSRRGRDDVDAAEVGATCHAPFAEHTARDGPCLPRASARPRAL